MNTSIIIEGYWNIGKTTVAKFLSNEFKMRVITEPDHMLLGQVPDDLDGWYTKKHLNNQKEFIELNRTGPVIMERSIMSTLAFMYSAGRRFGEGAEVLDDLTHWYSKHNALVVVLYAEASELPNTIEGIKNNMIIELYSNESFLKKYDHFFRNVLPFNYGIVPAFVNVFDSNGKRKTTSELVENIVRITKEDRVAQVNVVCYRKANGSVEFLSLKRNSKKGGFWQTITGGVHIRDLLKENALREVEEEVGVSVSSDRLISTDFSYKFIGAEEYELNEYVFGYEMSNDDLVSLSDEHTEYEWVNKEKMINRLKFEDNKRAIEVISKLIN